MHLPTNITIAIITQRHQYNIEIRLIIHCNLNMNQYFCNCIVFKSITFILLEKVLSLDVTLAGFWFLVFRSKKVESQEGFSSVRPNLSCNRGNLHLSAHAIIFYLIQKTLMFKALLQLSQASARGKCVCVCTIMHCLDFTVYLVSN